MEPFGIGRLVVVSQKTKAKGIEGSGISPEITDKLEALLGDNTVCYVLVTCQQPDKAGKMDVALSYSGDPMLASFLLHEAQDRIDCDFSPLR